MDFIIDEIYDDEITNDEVENIIRAFIRHQSRQITDFFQYAVGMSKEDLFIQTPGILDKQKVS